MKVYSEWLSGSFSFNYVADGYEHFICNGNVCLYVSKEFFVGAVIVSGRSPSERLIGVVPKYGHVSVNINKNIERDPSDMQSICAEVGMGISISKEVDWSK